MAQLEDLSGQTEMLSQVMNLVEVFRAFDADNDGSITAAELRGIMGSLGYSTSEQEVKAMMQEGDTNKDGLLSLDEFLEINTKEMELGDLANSLKTAFDALDLDGNGDVTGEELYELMTNMGINLPLEDCQDIIAALDEDGDGVVSIEEFKLIVDSLT
ncbi:hypothetical protein HHK36_009048 [Tetracentron sinense]|uniref:EF-hand domain-containing protein n=1 Tax=Tetracentron sinense TaxID=13715 RepID=A0A834ZFI4_TETSI|nr:hypothetical protein HHK36_031848 [Tetracentron sinense]KAF8404168.1 hypothetical protein HHK36_009048 [Tetracentron sinense]